MNDDLRAKLKTACEGLYYISETDASIETIEDADPVVGDDVEKVEFQRFFAPLTALHDGYQELQIARAKKFLELQKLLEENLTDLTVYKKGAVRKTVYVVGLDDSGELSGIKTEAVET